jgi:C4-type Zn-finger protein
MIRTMPRRHLLIKRRINQMAKKSAKRVLVKCPVCQSTDLVQHIETPISSFSDRIMIYGNGSHCNRCGVMLAFNTTRLDQEIQREMEMLSKATKKAKEHVK